MKPQAEAKPEQVLPENAEKPTLSICVVARNEEAFLLGLLRDIEAQTWPRSQTEIVLVDSASTDRTKEIMLAFSEQANGYYNVLVLDNPKKILAPGWNAAITHATGDVIVRIDAHAKIPPEFAALVMRDIASGENIVGGVRPCITEKDTPWAETLLSVENALFGSGIAPSRRSQKKMYVKTVFHGAYRKEVFEKVGLFNETLFRTEDNEMHYRIRQAGYRFCYDPEIVSYQYFRGSLRRMLKQKYGNGYWIGRTLHVCPGCVSAYHLIPAAFVASILVTSLLAFVGIWQLSALMWGLYAAFALLSTAVSIAKEGWLPQKTLMPFIFLALHLAYGVGTWSGFLSPERKGGD